MSVAARLVVRAEDEGELVPWDPGPGVLNVERDLRAVQSESHVNTLGSPCVLDRVRQQIDHDLTEALDIATDRQIAARSVDMDRWSSREHPGDLHGIHDDGAHVDALIGNPQIPARDTG